MGDGDKTPLRLQFNPKSVWSFTVPVFRTVMGSSRVNGPPRGRRLGKGRGFGISTLVRTMDIL